MKLAIFSFSPQPSYTRLQTAVQAMGHEAYEVLFPTDGSLQVRAWDGVEKLLSSADALLMQNGMVFQAGGAEWQDIIHRRVGAGELRLLVQSARGDQLEAQNRFLRFYGLSGTPLRLHSPTSRQLEIPRSGHAFRDPRLFLGVDTVTLEGATLVCAREQALACLLATGETMAVDPQTDYEAGWVGEERPLMAVWLGDTGGVVLLIGGGVLQDPTRSMNGAVLPGITANERLAENILRLLLPSNGRAERLEIGPDELMARTERNLADFVLGILKKTSNDWWSEHVPVTIRREAAMRYEDENGRFPKEAFLNLIDLREIMQKNFAHFSHLLDRVGWRGGRDASTAWLKELNEHRRLVAHPLRAHISGHRFSGDDLLFLREVDGRVAELLRLGSSEPTQD